MNTAAPATMAARRKTSRTRNYANTMVHYLGVEEALEACRKKEWHEVREEILRRHPAPAPHLP